MATVVVEPVKSINPVEMLSRGAIKRVFGISWVAGNLPTKVFLL